MPHVDDGILHAYLDGAIDALDAAGELPDGMAKDDVVAHLSTCADCRSRLEAEREIRERAGLVLHDASLPRVDVPPLPATRPAARRSLPLSWAASIVLAVGAGWWGSAQWRAQVFDATAVSQESASSQFDAERSAEPSAVEQSAFSTSPRSAEESGLSDAAQSPVATPGASSGHASPPVAEAPPAVQADSRSVARRAEAEPPPAANVIDEVRSERPLAATDTALPGEAARSTEVARDALVAADVASSTSSARLELQDTRDIAAGALRPMETQSAPVYFIPNAELRAFEGVLERERRGQLRWITIGADDAEEMVGQLFVIEGASEPVIEQARGADAASVRITQTLASGVPVELLVWRQDAVAMSEVANAATRGDSSPAGEQARPVPAAPPPAARARQAPAAPPSVAAQSFMSKALAASSAPMMTTGASHILPDGRRELVLRSSASPVWVALRAEMTDAEIGELARRLVVFGSRR